MHLLIKIRVRSSSPQWNTSSLPTKQFENINVDLFSFALFGGVGYYWNRFNLSSFSVDFPLF